MSHAPDSMPTPGSGPPRRDLLKMAALALSGLAGLAAGIPIVGYLLSPLFTKHRKDSDDVKDWPDLGPVDTFPIGQTRLHIFDNPISTKWDGMTAHTGVYVRNKGKNAQGEDDFMVLAVSCTHLGCPVSWFQQSGLFLCPCHGGAYYEDGGRASGPPPEGLFHYVAKVVDGHLRIKPPHLPTLHDPLNPENPNARGT